MKHITFKELRKKAGLTQRELALKMNIDVRCIEKYEGYYRTPTRRIHDVYMNALGCTEKKFESALIDSMLNCTKRRNTKEGLKDKQFKGEEGCERTEIEC